MARPTSGALKMQLCRQIHRCSRTRFRRCTRPPPLPSPARPRVARQREQAGGTALGEAELEIDGLAAKSAQQERLIAHLERFNAHVLEENEELRRLLLAKEG